MNLLASAHDCFCECDNPILHTIVHCFEQEKQFNFTAPEKDLIKQCLTGTTASDAAGDPGIDAFTGEELEKLFQEDAAEDNAITG